MSKVVGLVILLTESDLISSWERNSKSTLPMEEATGFEIFMVDHKIHIKHFNKIRARNLRSRRLAIENSTIPFSTSPEEFICGYSSFVRGAEFIPVTHINSLVRRPSYNPISIPRSAPEKSEEGPTIISSSQGE